LVKVSGVADSREVKVGADTNLWEFPLGALYHDARTQVIYLPEELGGAGQINALALDVASVPGQTLSNWTIRLKHTPSTSYAQAAWESVGWTTVYQNHEIVQTAGWVTFLFAAPFAYDGTNSLLVDFSFNNSTYSANGLCRSTSTNHRRSLSFQTDSGFGDPLEWNGSASPPPTISERIPNARFFFESPLALVPDGAVLLTDGVWMGPMAVPRPGTNVFLRASDTAGHLAQGNLFTVDSAEDADGDGLPDAWEIRYFGTTGAQPHADDDGDGFDNLEEFRAGTNPLEATSVLRIQSVQVHGEDLVIRFGSVSGKAYRLERSPDLVMPHWTAVLEMIPGTGGVVEIPLQGAAGGERSFYRLRLAP
jgi:hypothetical protein